MTAREDRLLGQGGWQANDRFFCQSFVRRHKGRTQVVTRTPGKHGLWYLHRWDDMDNPLPPPPPCDTLPRLLELADGEPAEATSTDTRDTYDQRGTRNMADPSGDCR